MILLIQGFVVLFSLDLLSVSCFLLEVFFEGLDKFITSLCTYFSPCQNRLVWKAVCRLTLVSDRRNMLMCLGSHAIEKRAG